MTDIARVMSQLAYLEIFTVQGNSQIDVKGWIANQDYLVDTITSASSFTLSIKNKEYLQIALANDCNRMAMAAVESIIGIQKEKNLPKSSSWAVIRAYYATFFSIHSLLRFFGHSFSQLGKEHISRIEELALAQNISLPAKGLNSGFYDIAISKDFSKVTFSEKKDSHKDTWGCFLELIESIDSKISQTASLSKHQIVTHLLLDQIKKGITRNNHAAKGNWLSDIRNKVNYQHLFGAWYPYENPIVDFRLIEAMSENWKNDATAFDISNRKKDLEIFFELTSVLLATFRELLIECATKSGSTNKIFTNGVIRLLKQKNKRKTVHTKEKN